MVLFLLKSFSFESSPSFSSLFFESSFMVCAYAFYCSSSSSLISPPGVPKVSFECMYVHLVPRSQTPPRLPLLRPVGLLSSLFFSSSVSKGFRGSSTFFEVLFPTMRAVYVHVQYITNQEQRKPAEEKNEVRTTEKRTLFFETTGCSIEKERKAERETTEGTREGTRSSFRILLSP